MFAKPAPVRPSEATRTTAFIIDELMAASFKAGRCFVMSAEHTRLHRLIDHDLDELQRSRARG